MTLGVLLEQVETRAVRGPLDVEVAGIAYDSRRVKPGDAFFALGGRHQDGAAFARQAVAAGAVAVVGRGVAAEGATVVEVPEPRQALARAAARFFDDPSRALRIVAVTGTNGKTTTTYMLEAIFRAQGWTPGIIGTTGIRLGDERRASALTTPESLELHALLAEMRSRGVAAVALEASSHALVQCRVFGLHSEVAVFTNLSRDHLDYHGTMEAYLDAKLALFDGRNDPDPPKQAVAVVNADDPAAARVIDAARRGGMRSARFSGDEDSVAEDLAVRVTKVEPGPQGLRLHVATRRERAAAGPRSVASAELTLPLLGRYNAANAAAAWTAAMMLGVSEGAIARGLEALAPVPGRLERVEAGQDFMVVVDYAHTPDALRRALAALREHAPGRLLVVFGCGGDRDRGKRPLMGAAAAAAADRAWVTNDNPRGEDPAAIAREVVAGAADALTIELDRRRAIAAALAEARPGDAVLIAGKGHETTQTIGDRVLPFDDREVARMLLRERTAERAR